MAALMERVKGMHRIPLRLEGSFVVAIDSTAAFEEAKVFLNIASRVGADCHFAKPKFVYNSAGELIGGDWCLSGSTEPEPISLASPERATEAQVKFNAAILSLSQTATDEFEQALVESALNVVSDSDVLLIDDRVVLCNWGLVPDWISTTDERIAYRLETIGLDQLPSFDPLSSASLLTPEEAPPESFVTTLASGSSNPTQGGNANAVWLATGASLLALLLLPGVLVRSSDTAGGVSVKALLERSETTNDQLRELIENQRQKRAEFDCQVSPKETVSSQIIEGSMALSRRELRAIGEQGTVLILASMPDEEVATGTGFFISPTDILTNAHVIEGAKNLRVTNTALNDVLEVDVVSEVLDKASGQDFALLRVTQPLSSVQFLSMSTSLEPSQDVFAAGFPGNLLGIEMEAQQQSGSPGAATMHFTPGVVSGLPAAGLNTAFISHTANIMSGSSGGPLLDRCGNVVGINTSVLPDERVMSAIGIAQTINGALRFLDVAGSDVSASTVSCSKVGMP